MKKNMNVDKEKKFISVGEASRLSGLEAQTIRKMADSSSILCYKTPGGKRRIDLSSLQKLCNATVSGKTKQTVPKQNIIYARVSSRKQLDDLSRQVDYLKRPEYIDYNVITDVASGINFQRKGLSTILEACLQKRIGEVVIANRDRLCRFGYELIEQLVKKAGGKITVLNNPENKSSEQELADDLLAIVHIFSCRQMGKRRYARSKSEDIADKDLSNQGTETTT